MSWSSSTASFVVEDRITAPPGDSTGTCAVGAPFFTPMILPLSTLRALSFMSRRCEVTPRPSATPPPWQCAPGSEDIP